MITSISFKSKRQESQLNIYFEQENVIVDINGEDIVELESEDVVLLLDLLKSYGKKRDI